MYNPQLDAFIKVADSGSFSKAAEAVYFCTCHHPADQFIGSKLRL
nr:LysR family transcriptional regulator [uncultured Agathobacter sp.]